ncbi:MAG TPA: oxidoreductase, partial [Fibrobacteres bacterium]|nr:oxidoreductase [Fibrobacterota bacterium]
MALKIGVIGAGGMASYHIPGFRSGGAEVVAIADQNLDAAKRATEKYGVDKAFGGAKEMYSALKDLDAVSIITPNAFHHPLVIEALAHGKHVFCEKPPALNAADVAQMA